MGLFKDKKKSEIVNEFNKEDVIRDILENKDEQCPGWSIFKIYGTGENTTYIDNIGKENEIKYEIKYTEFNKIKGDFLAIYTDVINKEIRLKSNPFSDYKRTVESIYQIVREIYINDQDNFDDDNIYKRITAKSAKELFIKLKREQE